MRAALRRPPLWFFLATVALVLEICSLYIATFPVYVNRLSRIQTCPPGASTCVTLWFEWVPTYPYVWLGIVLFAGGAAAMAAAVIALRRAPRRPAEQTVSA